MTNPKLINLQERTWIDPVDIPPLDPLIDSYQVAYRYENDVVKIVRIGLEHGDGVRKYEGILQIQKIGLDASLESIEFLDGEAWSYMNHSTVKRRESCADDIRISLEKLILPNLSQSRMEEILTHFGEEFKLIFDTNPKLKNDWPEFCKDSTSKYFTALIPYLK